MHVDRTQFLLLTAAIAAGCGANQSQPPAAAPVLAAPDYDTTTGPTTVSPQPVATSQIASEEWAVSPEPPVEGPSSEAQVAPAVEPVDPVLAQRCSLLRRPGPICESFDETVDSCSEYSSVMVPQAAAAAVSCLAKRSGTKRICEFGVDAKCATEGTKAAPLDSAATKTCASVMSTCAGNRYRGKDLNTANCRAVLSGYLPAVRPQLVSCITEFCEISSCFYQLR